MYDKLREFPKAEKLYLRIIELEPANMSNYYVLAEFYKRYAGEKKEIAKKAESMYLRRIETDPRTPRATPIWRPICGDARAAPRSC